MARTGNDRWALRCECGHTATGRSAGEAVANAQAHALDVHGWVIPAEVLGLKKKEKR